MHDYRFSCQFFYYGSGSDKARISVSHPIADMEIPSMQHIRCFHLAQDMLCREIGWRK